MTKLWFKNKRYDWGWYPITWEGWAAILVFVLIDAGVILLINATQNPWYLAVTIIAAIGLIVLGYKKGEKPRWRWGNDRVE